ncbi:hypothetical protein SJI00_20645 [Pseudomonas sp. RP23018S]|uniref:hypothetical protein n=1 Tax=Pseudomonas sp. RP23018S TaxID=3096037 RepID=UPI002ACAF62E|nr:hypothetical protein [Pseudomonas sp. RP23018S]MDZ5605184.1 hypothetical protein [Pseudomonas sp. RP23018S]
MNWFLRDAVITRLSWVDVVTFDGQPDCLCETGQAVRNAFDAVRDLAVSAITAAIALDDAPHILADVPALAEHFRVVYQVSTELQCLAMYGGPTSRVASSWLGESGTAFTLYSSWLAEVTLHLADLMALPCSQASIALNGQGNCLLQSWGEGMDSLETAEHAYFAYVDQVEMEEEEERRLRFQDEADYFACVEADLWRGWRQEYEEDLKAADFVD